MRREISRTHSKIEFIRMSCQPLKFVESLSDPSLFSSAVIKFNYFPFLAITFQIHFPPDQIPMVQILVEILNGILVGRVFTG
ncbi:hypothetical protein P9112_003967 [Eukaryota sp. TZLM1-RC]